MLAVEKPDLLKESRVGYRFRVSIDKYSRRIWVFDYLVNDAAAMTGRLKEVAMIYGLDKIILPALNKDRQALEEQGFICEGQVAGFFQGRTASFMVFYTDVKRGYSVTKAEEQVMRTEIMAREVTSRGRLVLPPGFRCRESRPADLPALARLYRQVFVSYPTPVGNIDYLAATVGKSAYYQVITWQGEIVSVAAGEIDITHNNAEMTNCATLPEFRGKGLMHFLLAELDQQCARMGIVCRYTLARAGSYGMNLVFHRLNYRYGGTLTNNCHIAGGLGNMNIWVNDSSRG